MQLRDCRLRIEPVEGLCHGHRIDDVERLEDAFRQALGTRVRLVKGRRGGRLVITFFSDDELQGLYEAIVRGSG